MTPVEQLLETHRLMVNAVTALINFRGAFTTDDSKDPLGDRLTTPPAQVRAAIEEFPAIYRYPAPDDPELAQPFALFAIAFREPCVLGDREGLSYHAIAGDWARKPANRIRDELLRIEEEATSPAIREIRSDFSVEEILSLVVEVEVHGDGPNYALTDEQRGAVDWIDLVCEEFRSDLIAEIPPTTTLRTLLIRLRKEQRIALHLADPKRWLQSLDELGREPAREPLADLEAAVWKALFRRNLSSKALAIELESDSDSIRKTVERIRNKHYPLRTRGAHADYWRADQPPGEP